MLVMLRPIAMWALMYWPFVAAVGIGVRWLTWLALGWPITFSAAAVTMVGASPIGWPLVVVCWVVEAGVAWLVPGSGMWRRGCAIRRKWPTVWAVIDHATTDVQAAFGGGISTFHAAGKSRRLTRPIMRHPPWKFWPVAVDAASITWATGPPPGTTLGALEKVEAAISEAYVFPAVVHVDVDFPAAGVSWGTIQFWFESPPDKLKEIDADQLETAVWDGPNDLGWDTDPTTEMELP